MNPISRVIAWARANRKYTLGAAVLVLVFFAVTHPGAKGNRPHSAEVLLASTSDHSTDSLLLQ